MAWFVPLCDTTQPIVKCTLQNKDFLYFSYSRLGFIHKNILSLHRVLKNAAKLIKII